MGATSTIISSFKDATGLNDIEDLKALLDAKGIDMTSINQITTYFDAIHLLEKLEIDKKHRRRLAEVLLDANASATCSHAFLELWGLDYVCSDCHTKIHDADRVAAEESCRRELSDLDTSTTLKPQDRAVTVEWLVAWTNRYDCWHMPTWQVRRQIIIPATSEKRCRYVELPEVKNSVGRVKTFISHSWGGTFGDLVAAVAENADSHRYVWVDIFAIRQWPGLVPDLDFRSTVFASSSFLLVCSSLPEVAALDWDVVSSRRSNVLEPLTRRKIAFLRAWCLVEIFAAITSTHDLALTMAGGNYEIHESGHVFRSDEDMLEKMAHLIDVENAEASVESDKQFILDELRKYGLDFVNKTIAKLVFRAKNSTSLIRCAAYGDVGALTQMMNDPESIHSAAGGGFDKLLQVLIDAGAEVNHVRPSGDCTALILAAESGSLVCVEALLLAGASLDYTEERNWSALVIAANAGHTDCLRVLLHAGAAISNDPISTPHPLSIALGAGNIEVVHALLDFGLKVDQEYYLICAAGRGDLACMKLATAQYRKHLHEHGNTDHYVISGSVLEEMAKSKADNCACLEYYLSEEAADPNVLIEGYTIIFGAAYSGNLGVFELLIKHNAILNMVDNYDYTPATVCMWGLIQSQGESHHGSDYIKCLERILSSAKTQIGWDAERVRIQDYLVDNAGELPDSIRSLLRIFEFEI